MSSEDFWAFWRSFGEGTGLKNPVTEPKRIQKPKGPLFTESILIATALMEMLQMNQSD
jgi:hypothetical protein